MNSNNFIIIAHLQVMVKYCGYLVGDASLYQRALDIGYPPVTSRADVNQTIIMATRYIRSETGVYAYTKLRRVITNKGKRCWCIAFASDAFWERLPTSAPSEEKYRPLKEELKKDGPPRWYLAD